MDAKPQKPIRSFRARDENALPAPAPKTLRSRNKSSPALSSLAAAGAAKLNSKRPALGDIGNVVHPARLTREESGKIAEGKGDLPKPATAIQKNKEDIQNKEDKELPSSTAQFLKPAQRPLSVATGLRTLLNSVSIGSVTSKHSATVNTYQQPLIEKKTVSDAKIKTSVETDQAKLLAEKPAVQQKSDQTTTRDFKVHLEPALSVIPEISRPLPLKKVQSSYSVLPTQRLDHHKADISKITSDVQNTKLEDSQEGELRKDTKKELATDSKMHALVADDSLHSNLVNEDPIPAQPEKPTIIEHVAEIIPIDPALDGSGQAHQASLSTIPEPEDVWDVEEDDEDNYDEEGYVTARSFRSRGENMTGNATTTLVPRFNAKAKKEIEIAKALVESMQTPEDIDDDRLDTTMVAEYGDEIFEYMRELEVRMSPHPHYMEKQTEIRWSMRSILMNWLVQVHHRFQLLPETLFLCVNLIDRFLSVKVVSLNKLQLVGATAIFVAAKYEEINCPSVGEIVYMVDNGYTVDEVLRAERFMLSMLEFEIGWPGPMSFLRRISKADDYDLETRTLAKYLLEVTIMDERFLGCTPSFLAAGAHCLARMMLKKGNWSPAHVYYANYTYAQLFPLVQLLLECCENPTTHHSAIFDKYQDRRYKAASFYVADELRDGFELMDIATNSAYTLLNFYSNVPIPNGH